MQKPELLYCPFIIFHNQGTIKKTRSSVIMSEKRKGAPAVQKYYSNWKVDGTGVYTIGLFSDPLLIYLFGIGKPSILTWYMWTPRWRAWEKLGVSFSSGGAIILPYMGVSENRGKTPKMDGENNGKPY